MKAHATNALMFLAPVAAAAALSLAPSARAQSPAAAIPAAPATPGSLPFADEVGGRRALFAARDAYRSAASVQFKANIRTLAQNGAAKPTVSTATETIAAAPAERRLSLTHEMRVGGTRQVRRAVANGESMIATRYEEKAGTPAVREVTRVPLVGDVATLPDGLRQLRVAPTTRAGVLLLDPNWNVRGTTWRAGTSGGVETVVEVDADATDNRSRLRRVRRYGIDARSRLLRSVEEWETVSDLRGGNATNTRTRTTYRREDYGTGGVAGKPLAASLFAQAVPSGYQEVAVPSGGPEVPEGPLDMDPKAAAVLARWEKAWKRFTSLNARVTLTTDVAAKTAQSRPVPEEWRGQQWEYAVKVRRPGRIHLTLAPVPGAATSATPSQGGGRDRGRRGGGGAIFDAQTAVSDGEAVVVTGDRGGRERPVPLGPDPSLLGVRVRQAGYRDAAETLTWLLLGPRSLVEEADTVAYRGQTSVDGATVDVVEITENDRQEQGGRRRRGSGEIESTLVTTVYIGTTDGLPRRTERYRTVRIERGLVRDDPPDLLFVAIYRNVVTDTPVAQETFRLPAGASRRTAERGR